MGILDRVASALRGGGASVLPSFADFFSRDGIRDDINRRGEYLTAYYSNAYRACALAKARPLAALPVHVYERHDGVRTATDKRAALDMERLLRGEWNPYMSATEGFRWLDMTKDALGEAFVRVEWQGARIAALWPLAGKPTIEIGAGSKPVFRYGGDKFTPAGTYLYYEVVWVKSPITDADGLHGVSLAELAADEVNMSIDLEQFYGHVLNGNGNFPGWLETPSKLTEQDFLKLKQQLADGAGVVNAGRVRIFDNGLTYRTTGQSMVDMSLVEQERWILEQLCRTLSVPPQEVCDLSNATYSNIEQGALNFANKTLTPECVEIERAFSRILWAIGLDDCYVQFDLNGLLRGSYKDRMEGYRIAINSGWLTRADVRAKEDLPPIPGLDAPMLQAAYNLIDPATGEVDYVATSNRSGWNEGSAPIHADMEQRIRARFEEGGDTPKFRDFAARVLAPYAEACAAAGIEYDMESDIEGIIR